MALSSYLKRHRSTSSDKRDDRLTISATNAVGNGLLARSRLLKSVSEGKISLAITAANGACKRAKKGCEAGTSCEEVFSPKTKRPMLSLSFALCHVPRVEQ